MVDIETMATSDNASIMAIGAAVFDAKTPPERGFYQTISLNDIGNEHREIDPKTVMWWLSQEKEAQNSLIAEETRKKFRETFLMFGEFVEKNLGKDGIWANGVSFDLGILRHAFEQENLPVPWRYNQECCMRTFRLTEKYNIFDAKWKKFKKENSNFHNAVEDEDAQACYVYYIIKEKE